MCCSVVCVGICGGGTGGRAWALSCEADEEGCRKEGSGAPHSCWTAVLSDTGKPAAGYWVGCMAAAGVCDLFVEGAAPHAAQALCPPDLPSPRAAMHTVECCVMSERAACWSPRCACVLAGGAVEEAGPLSPRAQREAC
jgi:hypothetical protein